MPLIQNHQASTPSDIVRRRMEHLKPGDKMQDLPEEIWHDSFRRDMNDPDRKGGPNSRIYRLDPDGRCLTLTVHAFSKFVHPYEDRYITPREGARLQGFPDSYTFSGTLTSVRRQVGNAVPIELGEAVFASVLDALRASVLPAPYTSVSLFSGAGGLDIALERASASLGIDTHTLAVVDSDPDCCDTLRLNLGCETRVIEADVSKLHIRDSIGNERVDIVYGGPPCQSFSQSGRQYGFRDIRGMLVFEFLRVVSELQPAFFVMENVPNFKGVSSGSVFKMFLIKAYRLPYHITYGMLDASHYGNAQKRKRLIFIGAACSIRDSPVFLPPRTHGRDVLRLPGPFALQPYTTVRQALRGLPQPERI